MRKVWLIAIMCVFLMTTMSLSAKTTKKTGENYVNNVVLFAGTSGEDNIWPIPVGTVFHYVDQGRDYYLPQWDVNPEHYEGVADFPDCYWLYVNEGMYPPDHPELFTMVQ